MSTLEDVIRHQEAINKFNRKLGNHNKIVMADVKDAAFLFRNDEKKERESIRRRRNYMRNKEDNPEAHKQMLELRRLKYKQKKELQATKN